MAAITKPATREIIDDFAKEIRAKRMSGAKPSKKNRPLIMTVFCSDHLYFLIRMRGRVGRYFCHFPNAFGRWHCLHAQRVSEA